MTTQEDRIFNVLERVEKAIADLNANIGNHILHCAKIHGDVDQRLALIGVTVERYARNFSKLGQTMDEYEARVYTLERRADFIAAGSETARLVALESWKIELDKILAAKEAANTTERKIWNRLLPLVGATSGVGAAAYQFLQGLLGS